MTSLLESSDTSSYSSIYLSNFVTVGVFYKNSAVNVLFLRNLLSLLTYSGVSFPLAIGVSILGEFNISECLFFGIKSV